jgi:glutamate synthase (NADPH/NADH) small chain
LAAAQQLNRAGHAVTVFRKGRSHRRIAALWHPRIQDGEMGARPAAGSDVAEGVEFRTGVNVGKDITGDALQKEFDAILLAGGAEQPRDLPVPGRELKGIHFAMEFLPQQNKRCAGDEVPDQILATGKHVVIIGGGDTGADCLGTSHRQKAASVHQFEIMPMPPNERAPQTPWPLWPLQLRVESSHEEGGVREWSMATASFRATRMAA